jgi:hypothetical protein
MSIKVYGVTSHYAIIDIHWRESLVSYEQRDVCE